MADRKVLIKYYPPDFDPEKLAQKGRQFRNHDQKRRGRGGAKLMNVRFMFPFTMCCGMCNEFIYIGTKFNSRVEKIKGEDYLGIPIWRFYGRCPHCRAEIAFKTDPQHTEYVLESGGTRTYDPRKDAALAESTLKEQLEEEIATDSMKALEHKTYSTANELQSLEQLDELRKINKRFLSREATVEFALEWLKTGGVEKEPEPEFDEAELEEFRQAKEDMDVRRLQKSLGSDSSDESDNEEPSMSNEETLLLGTSSELAVADIPQQNGNRDAKVTENSAKEKPAEKRSSTAKVMIPFVIKKKRAREGEEAAVDNRLCLDYLSDSEELKT